MTVPIKVKGPQAQISLQFSSLTRAGRFLAAFSLPLAAAPLANLDLGSATAWSYRGHRATYHDGIGFIRGFGSAGGNPPVLMSP